MRVLFVTHTAGLISGNEHFQAQAAVLLRLRGIKVDVAYVKAIQDETPFTNCFSRALLLPEVLKEDIPYDAVFIHRMHDNSTLRTLIAKYPRLAMVYHDHTLTCPQGRHQAPGTNCDHPFSLFRCSLCTFFRGACLRDMFMPRPERKDFRERLELCHKIPTAIVMSQFMRDILLKNHFPPRHIQCLHPFIDLRKTTPRQHTSSNSAVKLLFVGSLTRCKGADVMLKIMQRMPATVTATLVGGPVNDKDPRAAVRKAGLEDRVEYVGKQDDISPFYQSHDILVIPSRWQDPLATVGIEAAAHGLPIVTFDTGGCREFLINDYNGMLAPEGDINTLINAIILLVEQPDLRKQYGKNGREMVCDAFSPELFVNDFLKIVDKMNRRSHNSE